MFARMAHCALHLAQQDGVAGPGGAYSRLSNTGRSVFAAPRAGEVARTCRRCTVRRARASGTTTQTASTTKSKMATSLRAPATPGSGASWAIPQATNARTATSRMRAWRPLGRMSDAHGCDGAVDKEQRHGGRARMVGPPGVAADPVGNDKQDTSGDGDHAKADSGEEPDAGRVQMLKLIHCPDAIAALHGRDLQRRLARGGTAGGLTGAPGRSRLQRKLVPVSLRSSVRDRPGQLKGLSAREPANGMAWLSFRWRGAGR